MTICGRTQEFQPKEGDLWAGAFDLGDAGAEGGVE